MDIISITVIVDDAVILTSVLSSRYKKRSALQQNPAAPHSSKGQDLTGEIETGQMLFHKSEV